LTYTRRRRTMSDNNTTWAEILGTGLGLFIVAVLLFALGAAFMLIPAWIVHWILVNLFNYTVLTIWQVWGIIIGVRMIFGGLNINTNN
jgi:hypothetical protein